MDRPKNKVGRLGLNPPDRHRKKKIDAGNLTDAGRRVKHTTRRSGAMMARLILCTCPLCEEEVRREPAAENGAVQIWCGCDEHSFPIGNLLPENPEEWEFVVKRVSRRVRDAQAECEARIRRLMVSDHVRKYRDKFAKDGANA